MKSFPQKMTTRVRWVCPFNRSRSPWIREGPDWRGARLRIQVLWGSVAFRFCTQFFLSFSLPFRSENPDLTYTEVSEPSNPDCIYRFYTSGRGGGDYLEERINFKKRKCFCFLGVAENISMCMFSHVYDFTATILNDHFLKIIIVRASNEEYFGIEEIRKS